MPINSLLGRHKLKFGLTLFLIFTEAIFTLFFPLFIGFAIEGAISGSYFGAVQLGILGLAALIVGAGRRFFDSRFYAYLYEEMGAEAISNMRRDKPSIKSARLGMIGELVEFLENSLPELINAIIGLLGVIAIIASLNFHVFYGTLIVTVTIFLIYCVSSNQTTLLNKASNDEMEKQVDVISSKDEKKLKIHLRKMMKWNIKLSDLEALNFSMTWIVLMSLLVASIILLGNRDVLNYGALFSLIMYVFQYIENVVNLPFFYQNWLRLKEIKSRIERP